MRKPYPGTKSHFLLQAWRPLLVAAGMLGWALSGFFRAGLPPPKPPSLPILEAVATPAALATPVPQLKDTPHGPLRGNTQLEASSTSTNTATSTVTATNTATFTKTATSTSTSTSTSTATATATAKPLRRFYIYIPGLRR